MKLRLAMIRIQLRKRPAYLAARGIGRSSGKAGTELAAPNLKICRQTVLLPPGAGRHQNAHHALGFSWIIKRIAMNDLNGWGVARKMIELYGKEAQNEARRRCERALKRED